LNVKGVRDKMVHMPRGDADVTREKLLAAAHDLFVARAGHAASVSEICERAEVNVAMVKYCFGSKDGLLDALLERVLTGLAGEIERLSAQDLEPGEKLRRHVSEIVRNYVRYPYVNRLMNERLTRAEPAAVEAISASFAVPARDFYTTLLAAGAKTDGWRTIDPTLFFFSVVGLCEFLFAATPLLERSFGATLDDALVERYIDHVTALIGGGVSR
jgi:TetR/AcrR family transcriptional regulator